MSIFDFIAHTFGVYYQPVFEAVAGVFETIAEIFGAMIIG